MSENNTIDPSTLPQVEKSKSLGIGKIEGKEVFITGYQHNRGRASPFTPKDEIDEEGMTDYYTIKTEASFDLEYKEDGVIPINNFFIKPAQAQQIERIPNFESVNNGGRIGPVKAIKRVSQKDSSRSYWVFAFSNDEDYK